MRIREGRAEDAAELAALLVELGYPDEPERIAARAAAFAVEPSSRVLVAEEQGVLVGLASATVMPLLHEEASWCRLSALVVVEQAGKEGVGRALVEAVEEFARTRGCRLVEVTSGERREREAAHRFYAALGYEEVSRRLLKEL